MSNTWVIKDADGNITNSCILADEDFVKANFTHYEAFVPPPGYVPTAAEEARSWRDSELASTDNIPAITDHPQRAAYITYRTALRDWPSTSDFPATKPTLGS